MNEAKDYTFARRYVRLLALPGETAVNRHNHLSESAAPFIIHGYRNRRKIEQNMVLCHLHMEARPLLEELREVFEKISHEVSQLSHEKFVRSHETS